VPKRSPGDQAGNAVEQHDFQTVVVGMFIEFDICFYRSRQSGLGIAPGARLETILVHCAGTRPGFATRELIRGNPMSVGPTRESAAGSWEQRLRLETDNVRQAVAAYKRSVVALRALESQLERFDRRLDALVRTLQTAVQVLAEGAQIGRFTRPQPIEAGGRARQAHE
jgi:plasmid stabilization system protein ParE